MNILSLQNLKPQAPAVGILGNSCTSSTSKCCNGSAN